MESESIMIKGYLANGLFSIGDRIVNEIVAEELRNTIKDLDLYVPQENGEINDKNSYASSQMIVEGDMNKLQGADFLVAVIDGVEIDSGTACEIGIAYTLGTPIFALYTDVRQFGRDNKQKIDALIADATENQFVYRNLFVTGVVKESGGGIATNLVELVTLVRKVMEGEK